MRTTIDSAGRIVIPKSLRDELGIRPGEVDVTVAGAALRIEPVTDRTIVDDGDRLVIPASGVAIDDELVSDLRRGDQR